MLESLFPESFVAPSNSRSKQPYFNLLCTGCLTSLFKCDVSTPFLLSLMLFLDF
jgi:hypothetical protein